MIDLSNIWGKEISELRNVHVTKVKAKYGVTGYDLMLQKKEEAEKRKQKSSV